LRRGGPAAAPPSRCARWRGAYGARVDARRPRRAVDDARGESAEQRQPSRQPEHSVCCGGAAERLRNQRSERQARIVGQADMREPAAAPLGADDPQQSQDRGRHHRAFARPTANRLASSSPKLADMRPAPLRLARDHEITDPEILEHRDSGAAPKWRTHERGAGLRASSARF